MKNATAKVTDTSVFPDFMKLVCVLWYSYIMQVKWQLHLINFWRDSPLITRKCSNLLKLSINGTDPIFFGRLDGYWLFILDFYCRHVQQKLKLIGWFLAKPIFGWNLYFVPFSLLQELLKPLLKNVIWCNGLTPMLSLFKRLKLTGTFLARPFVW